MHMGHRGGVHGKVGSICMAKIPYRHLVGAHDGVRTKRSTCIVWNVQGEVVGNQYGK